jgi:trans-aconitate methyltransferase
VTDRPLRILDMGCGWGSVSLWFAEHFPQATVRGISNSNSQREWIMARAKKRGRACGTGYCGVTAGPAGRGEGREAVWALRCSP